MKISVCMAAYNGERFIAAQIKSILNQLSVGDELIIIDDGSTDKTCQIIADCNDTRIRLERHLSNHGIARSFEDALLRASGDVIFLSDQDDIWKRDKVATVVQAFAVNPEVTMIVSDATLIDQDGEIIANSYYRQRGKFSDRFLHNLMRCKYLGCTMAFRTQLLRSALPFPQSKFLLHDVWLGTANRLSGGKTQYLSEPMVCYRRHSSTATGFSHLSTAHRFLLRLHLLRAGAGFWLRRYIGDYRQ